MSNNLIPQPPLLVRHVRFDDQVVQGRELYQLFGTWNLPFREGKQISGSFSNVSWESHVWFSLGSFFVHHSIYLTNQISTLFPGGSMYSWWQKAGILLKFEPCRNLKGDRSHGKPVLGIPYLRLRHLKTSDPDTKMKLRARSSQEGGGTPQIQMSSQLSPMRVLMSCFTWFWQTHPAPLIFSQGIIKIKWFPYFGYPFTL